MNTITRIKKIALISFTAAMYLLPLAFFLPAMVGGDLTEANTNIMTGFWIAALIAGIVLAIANFVIAIIDFKKRANGDYTRVLRDIRKYKLILTPYFIINFLLWAAMIAVTLLFATWLFIPLGVIHAWMVMFVTSFYAILKIIDLMKREKISKVKGVLMIIIQLTFALDIFGIIYLGYLEKKLEDAPETQIVQQTS